MSWVHKVITLGRKVIPKLFHLGQKVQKVHQLGQKVQQAREVWEQAKGVVDQGKKVLGDAKSAIQHRDIGQAMSILRSAGSVGGAAKSTVESAKKVLNLERQQGKRNANEGF